MSAPLDTDTGEGAQTCLVCGFRLDRHTVPCVPAVAAPRTGEGELPAHITPPLRTRLRRWANRLCGRYGVPIYLAGSALREDNPDPRDWDIRITLPDEDFAIRFGPVYEWRDEGCTGNWTRTRFRWSDQCVKDTKDFFAWCHLNGDVQIYPASHVAMLYADKPRVRLDSFPDEDAAVPLPEAQTGEAYPTCGDDTALRGAAESVLSRWVTSALVSGHPANHEENRTAFTSLRAALSDRGEDRALRDAVTCAIEVLTALDPLHEVSCASLRPRRGHDSANGDCDCDAGQVPDVADALRRALTPQGGAR